MILRTSQIVVVLAALAGSLLAQAAGQSFHVDPTGPPPDGIPQKVKNTLVSDGIRLSRTVNGVDRPLADLWCVRTLTVRRSGKRPAGVAYPQLTPGKSLAVLYLPEAILDVTLQKVPPGFYRLQYLRPDLDNDAKDKKDKDKDEHEIDDEGEAITEKYQEYVSLTRLETDKRTGGDRAIRKSVKFSRQESAGRQPALLALLPLNPAYTAFPYAISDDVGHCALQFKVSVRLPSGRSGEMGVSIQLINPPDLSEDD